MEGLDAMNWTRWRVQPGASFCARRVFRDGPDQGHVHVNAPLTARFARKTTFKLARFARSPCSQLQTVHFRPNARSSQDYPTRCTRSPPRTSCRSTKAPHTAPRTGSCTSPRRSWRRARNSLRTCAPAPSETRRWVSSVVDVAKNSK